MSALRLTGPILESKGISAIFQKKGKIFENLGKNVNGQLHACDCRMHQTARICPRLIFKDKGGKQHCLRLVGSNLGIEIFLKKKGNINKRTRRNRGLRHLCTLCIGGSRKFYVKPVFFFIVLC